MQQESATQFNPLDFKKLSQKEQFDAARTMNQKDLIAVAGTGVPLETLLKHQGLSDAQIQKRLAELNPYLVGLSSLHQMEQSRTHKAERSHAEFYAMLEEQSHASAPTQAGHKLGNITNLSHDQQIHALADHFSHGGSIADAAKAYGATDKEAEDLEEFTMQTKAEIDKQYENEPKSAELNKKKEKELAEKIRKSGLGPEPMISAFADTIATGKAAPVLNAGDLSAYRVAKESASQANKESKKIAANVLNGTANEEERNTLKKIELSEKSSAKIQSELKNDKELKNEIIRNFIKDDASAANKVAAATMYAKGGVSEDSVSDAKDLEKVGSKAASAEALKSGVSVSKTNDDWVEPDIPKVGSIKLTEWQKKNAEAKAPAPENTKQLTA